MDTAGQSGSKAGNMEDPERGNLGRGAWDSREEKEKTNPPAQKASDGLELQCSLEQEVRKACLEGGEGGKSSRGPRKEDNAALSSLRDSGWREDAHSVKSRGGA